MSGKKAVALIVLAVVVLASLASLFLVPGAGGGFINQGDSVMVLRLSGPIQESVGGGLLGGGAITPRAVQARLQEAEDNQRVKAVVMRVETGGGSVAASQEISGLIQEFPKPVVVSMGDITASGGYYISSQADWIVAQPGTLTGSIGVIWTTFDIQELLDNLGVEMDAITAGEHKDMSLPGRLGPEERAIIQEMVDEIYQQFVDEVASGRERLTREEVLPLATGRLFTGSQALESGLVDELGGMPTAIAKAEELAGVQDAEVIEMRPSLWEALLLSPGFDALQWPAPGGPSVQNDLEALEEFLDGYAVPRFGG